MDADVDAETLSQAISALYFQAIDRTILNPSLNPADSIAPKLELLLRGLSTTPARP